MEILQVVQQLVLHQQVEVLVELGLLLEQQGLLQVEAVAEVNLADLHGEQVETEQQDKLNYHGYCLLIALLLLVLLPQ